MTSIACLNLYDSYNLLKTAEAALALSLEAIKGWVDPFDERIHRVRQHPGQVQIAKDIHSLVEGSGMCRSITTDDPGDGRPQDPYSCRCAPRVMAQGINTLEYASS